jgi:protein phosphatase
VDSSNGYRYYSPDQLPAARLIDVLREAGVPLAGIKVLLREPSGEQLDVWLKRVEDDAQQRQRALAVARRLLADERSTLDPQAGESARREPVMRLTAVARTETGQVRENNEDAVAGSDRLAVVADGMGGHPGGEVASAAAVSLLQAAYTGRSLDELHAAVRAANRAIWDRASATDELEGMGTTVCAAGLTDDGCLAIVHVGDSRAYVLRDGALQQLTHDHSVTAELVSRGELSESQARSHPLHGYLTRALGAGPDVEPDARAYPARAGDRLIMCSDGLFNEVPDSEIASVAAGADDIEAAADQLIQLAQDRGGHDNISVVIADVSAE